MGWAVTTTLLRYVWPFQSSQVTSTSRPGAGLVEDLCGLAGERLFGVVGDGAGGVGDPAAGRRDDDGGADAQVLEVVEGAATVVDGVPADDGGSDR